MPDMSHISNISTKKTKILTKPLSGTKFVFRHQTIEMSIDDIFYKRQVGGGPFAGRHFAPTSLPNTH